jgi:hypothetical protein
MRGVGGTNMENRGIEYLNGRPWWCLEDRPAAACFRRCQGGAELAEGS